MVSILLYDSTSPQLCDKPDTLQQEDRREEDETSNTGKSERILTNEQNTSTKEQEKEIRQPELKNILISKFSTKIKDV